MSIKLTDLLFEFSIEDYKSIPASDTTKEEDLIAVPEEEYLNIKKEIELEIAEEVVVEDFVARNLIQKNENKIDELLSKNQEKLKIAAESRKINLMKTLFENSDFQGRIEKGKIAQENVLSKLINVLNNRATENQVFTGNSNKVGENTTDVKIYENTNQISSIEVKNVSSFGDSISFFDKTIYENDTDPGKGNIFVPLIKKLFIQNKIVLLDTTKLQSDKKKKDLKVESLDLINSANILLKQAHIQTGEDFKNCVKFSEIPEELKNLLKENGLIHKLKDPDSDIVFNCSHEVYMKEIRETSEKDKTIKVFFFEPNSSLKFIYLSREVDNNIIFSRLRPRATKIEDRNDKIKEVLRTKDLLTIAKIGHGKMPRAVGTSGQMEKKCFSINLIPEQNSSLSSERTEIRTEVFNILSQHLKDDYFAVYGENQIRIIGSPKGEDKLNLTPNKLTAENIASVELRPYGATEVGKIRIKLECNINYNGFLTL